MSTMDHNMGGTRKITVKKRLSLADESSCLHLDHCFLKGTLNPSTYDTGLAHDGSTSPPANDDHEEEVVHSNLLQKLRLEMKLNLVCRTRWLNLKTGPYLKKIILRCYLRLLKIYRPAIWTRPLRLNFLFKRGREIHSYLTLLWPCLWVTLITGILISHHNSWPWWTMETNGSAVTMSGAFESPAFSI